MIEYFKNAKIYELQNILNMSPGLVTQFLGK